MDSELTEFLESEQQLLNYEQSMAAALQFLLLMSMFPVEGGLTEGFLVFLSKILLHLTVKRNSHLIVFCV